MSMRRNRARSLEALRGLALGMTALVNSAQAADSPSSTSAPPSYSEVCGNSAIAASTDDSPDDKARKEGLRVACQTYQLQVISNLSSGAKAVPIEETLAAFSNLKQLNGKLSGPASADHVGHALSQLVLAAAVRAIAPEVRKAPDWGSIRAILILEQGSMDARIQVASTTNWVLYVVSLMEASRKKLESTIEEIDMTIRGRRANSHDSLGARNLDGVTVSAFSSPFGYAPLAISAAQAIAGTMKVDVALSSISSTAKYEVIFASLASDPEIAKKLYFPGAMQSDWLEDEAEDRTPSGFEHAFADLGTSVVQVRDTLAMYCSGSGKKGATKEQLADITADCATLKIRLSESERLMETLLAVPAGKTQSTYQELVALSERFAPGGVDALLVVTASSFGAHGGVSTSVWRSDRLLYAADTVVTYTLIGDRGAPLTAGTIYGSGHIECRPTQDCLSLASVVTSAVPKNAPAVQTDGPPQTSREP